MILHFIKTWRKLYGLQRRLYKASRLLALIDAGGDAAWATRTRFGK